MFSFFGFHARLHFQPAEETIEPKAQKESSKFRFWKRKPKKEEKPITPPTPGTQNSSKACVIL